MNILWKLCEETLGRQLLTAAAMAIVVKSAEKVGDRLGERLAERVAPTPPTPVDVQAVSRRTL